MPEVSNVVMAIVNVGNCSIENFSGCQEKRTSECMVNEVEVDEVLQYLSCVVILHKLSDTEESFCEACTKRTVLSLTVNGYPSLSNRFKRNTSLEATSTKWPSATSTWTEGCFSTRLFPY
jgi:hypothetical protein